MHHRAPDALYAACEKSVTRRVVHVSAVGITETDTAYAASKRAGEACLMARDLDWTVLRPVIVIGDDSYGGTSLVRALAAFPFVMPVIDEGATPLEIIHKDDLAEGVVRLVVNAAAVREVLEPAASGCLTLLELVAAYRDWLRLPAGRVVAAADEVGEVHRTRWRRDPHAAGDLNSAHATWDATDRGWSEVSAGNRSGDPDSHRRSVGSPER